MPKFLFYGGTAFCLFLALSSGAEAARQLQGGAVAFIGLPVSAAAPAAIAMALFAGLAVAAIFVRMAALLAARNLFGAFFALFAVAGASVSLGWLLFLQSRIVALARGGASDQQAMLAELHFGAYLMLGCFVALTLFSLRPYFRIQSSRFISALVFFPLPIFLLVVAQELFAAASQAPLPATTPALLVLYGTLAVLFFSIAIHCIRHRHLFIETTNLRELLDGRVDPTDRAARPIRLSGGVAFDS